MYRQSNTLRATTAPTIDLTQPLKMEETTTTAAAATDLLPIYNRRNSGDIKRSRRSENLIHLIPVVVLLCLFILWWFSYPVELEIKDGRITAVYQIVTQNIPFVHLANLAAVSAPYPTISEMLILNNGSLPVPASSFPQR